MDTISLPIAAMTAIFAMAVGAGLCFVLMHLRHGGELHEAALRIDRALKARHQANELLLQARRQIELLTKEVELARRSRPAPATPRPDPASPVIGDDDAPTVVMMRPANGFADTQPYEPGKV